jgi:hypothetical protein
LLQFWPDLERDHCEETSYEGKKHTVGDWRDYLIEMEGKEREKAAHRRRIAVDGHCEKMRLKQ